MKDQKKEIQCTDSQKCATPPAGGESQSKPISVSLAEHLFALAKDVTRKDVSPDTVRAACQCASEIHKLLDLQWRIRR
jgi:hypothetical protein